MLFVIAISPVESFPGKREGPTAEKRLVLSSCDCAESYGAGPMMLRMTGR